MSGFDHEKIEQGVRLILEGVGEDTERGGLRGTPARVARMYEETLAGIGNDPTGIVTVVEGYKVQRGGLVGGIPVHSFF